MVSPDGRVLACNYITPTGPQKWVANGDLVLSRGVNVSDAVFIRHVN